MWQNQPILKSVCAGMLTALLLAVTPAAAADLPLKAPPPPSFEFSGYGFAEGNPPSTGEPANRGRPHGLWMLGIT
jgi:hypothetical protein